MGYSCNSSSLSCCRARGHHQLWDITTDTRYMVLPVQPPETVGWPEERLAEIATKESMIGVTASNRRIAERETSHGRRA